MARHDDASAPAASGAESGTGYFVVMTTMPNTTAAAQADKARTLRRAKPAAATGRRSRRLARAIDAPPLLHRAHELLGMVA